MLTMHPFEHAAYAACAARYGYDLDALSKQDRDAILIAVVDAEPQGMQAMHAAAVMTLESIAIVRGIELEACDGG